MAAWVSCFGVTRRAGSMAVVDFSSRKTATIASPHRTSLFNPAAPATGRDRALQQWPEEHPKASRAFVEGTARAIEWARGHPREEVIARFKTIIEKRARKNETTDVVDYWQSPGAGITGGVIQEREFTGFYDWLVANGELKAGLIDPRDAYTNQFNPYR